MSLSAKLSTSSISYALFFILPLILCFAVASESLQFLLSKWTDFSEHGAYNHGFLILAITIYLFIKYLRVQDIAINHNIVGLLLALFFMVLVFVFEAIHIVSLTVVSLYIFIFALVLTVFGWKVLKRTALPLCFLLFAIPIWDGFGPLLQKITLDASYLMVKASGIPALKDGFHIIIPEGSFKVDTGCSGFSYFMAALPLGVLYALFNFASKKHRLIIVVTIVFASVIANWIRVYIIIVAGHLTDMQHYFVTVEHFNLGWFIFISIFIILILILKKLLNNSSLLAQASGDNTIPQVRAQVLQLNKKFISMPLLISACALALVMLQLLLNTQLLTKKKITTTSIPPYFKQEDDLLPFGQLMLHETALLTTYTANRHEDPIFLVEANWKYQSQGKELVSNDNKLIDEELWLIVNQRIREISNMGEVIGKVKAYELTSKQNGQTYIVWTWYRIRQSNTVSPIKAKMHEFMGYLNGDNSGSILALISTGEKSVPYLESIYLYMSE